MKKAYFQIHAAIFLWGFTGIFGRLIELSDALLVWYRLAITSLCLFAFLLWRKQLSFPSKKELVKISVVGILLTTHWLFFYGSIKCSNVSIGVSCLSSTALFSSIFDPLYHRKKINPREIILGLGAIAGTYLIFFSQQYYATGILLGIGSAVLGGIFTTLNKALMEKHQAEIVSFYELGTGWIFLTLLLPFLLLFFPSTKLFPSNIDWTYLLLFSVFCTIIPIGLSLRALKKISPFAQNLSLNLEPLYGILLAIIVFHENRELNAGFYIGSLVIFGSVFLHGAMEVYIGQKTQDQYGETK